MLKHLENERGEGAGENKTQKILIIYEEGLNLGCTAGTSVSRASVQGVELLDRVCVLPGGIQQGENLHTSACVCVCVCV
jgi:hypothetical protein